MNLQIFRPEERQGEGGCEDKLGPGRHHKALLLGQEKKPGSQFLRRLSAVENSFVQLPPNTALKF